MKNFLQINPRYILLLIILFALSTRLFGLNWDQGQHLHPDERMITMVATNLRFPQTPTEWQNLFTSKSTLNPHFFAYGSLPIYLLNVSGAVAGLFNPAFASYAEINLVGRFLSAIFDTFTVLLLYFLGRRILNAGTGLLAALFYAVAVLPIQLAHFYAVDTILTFFVILTLSQLMIFNDKPTRKNAVLVGIFLALSLATKISAILAAVPIAVVLISKYTPKNTGTGIFSFAGELLKRLFSPAILILATTAIVFSVAEPFALIDTPTFIRQNLEQEQMTKNAFVFPYTLQYVGETPYLYELKNIFFWGLGPLLATFSLAGTIFLTFQLCRSLFINKSLIFNLKSLIILSFFWVYFAITGSFAIGFMRYMLPLYPLLCLFAAIFVEQLKPLRLLKLLKLPSLILNFTFLILLLIWPLSFISIYSHPNTRVLASEWILNNIKPGNTIAAEHWDDGLPLGGQMYYQIMTLPMYDPDSSPLKWAQVNHALSQSKYIIIASNRLYVPLKKLTNCQELPPQRCYKKTAQYYQELFGGQLGFTKVAEFAVYPTVPFLSYPINDFNADESFTVYDHPKVMIFKKVSSKT